MKKKTLKIKSKKILLAILVCIVTVATIGFGLQSVGAATKSGTNSTVFYVNSSGTYGKLKFQGILTYETSSTETSYTIKGTKLQIESLSGTENLASWGKAKFGLSITNSSTTVGYAEAGNFNEGKKKTLWSGSSSKTVTKGCGTKLEGITYTAKATYQGVGRDNPNNSNETWYSTVTVTKDVPARAKYTITYNDNTTATVSNMPSTNAISDCSGCSATTHGKSYGYTCHLSTKVPTRTGYTFKNWNTKSDGSGTSYAAGAAYSTNAALTLYAQWTEKTALATYKNGGHGGTIPSPNPVTMRYSTATYTKAALSATGYTFLGWRSSYSGNLLAAGALLNGANVTPAATTLTAEWRENTATLTYDANGHGTAPAAVTMRYTQATNAESAITDPNGQYTFTGWNTAADGSGTPYAPGSLVKAANVNPTAKTLYAQWEVRDDTRYLLKYNTGGATFSTVPPQSSTRDVTFTVPHPTKTGYTFLGWDITGMDTYTHHIGNTTTNATSASGVTATQFMNLSEGITQQQPTIPTVTFTAVWDVATYNLSYNLAGGTQTTSPPASATYDVPFTVETPTRTGYTFTGWDIAGMDSTTHDYDEMSSNQTSETGILAETFNNLRASSGTVSFTATWEADTNTISLNPNGGEYNQSPQITDLTVTYDQTTNNSPGPAVMEAFTFDGWYTSASGGTQVFDANGNCTTNGGYWSAAGSSGTWQGDEDLVLYAHWTFSKLFSETIPNITVDTMTVEEDGTASYSVDLKDGEYVSFLGLNTGAQYSVLENGENKYKPKFVTEAESAVVKRAEGEAGDDLGTPTETLTENTLYDYYNDYVHTGHDIIVSKSLAGDLITSSDYEEDFSFTVNVAGLDPDTEYLVRLPGADETTYVASNENVYITPTNAGTYTANFTLKAGEEWKMIGLPDEATYTVTENMRNQDQSFAYDAQYMVELGEDTVTQTGGYAAKTSQSLSTPQETMSGENVEFEFINSKSQTHSLQFVKYILEDGTILNSSKEFDFTFKFGGMAPNTHYESTEHNMSFTTDATGAATVDVSLACGETVTFASVPGTTYYYVVEKASNFVPSVVVENAQNGNTVDEAIGEWNADFKYASNRQGMSEDQIVTFNNIRNTTNDLTITKQVDGVGASEQDTFTVNVVFGGLQPDTTYQITGSGAQNRTMTSNSSGAATIALTVSDGIGYTFKDLPYGASYQITEAAANGYAPSFEVTAAGGGPSLDQLVGETGESLVIPEEQIVSDTEYTIKNSRMPTNPTKTVTDYDEVTLDGSGQEVGVVENTVENRNSVWTYTITQEVPSNTESFELIDTLPPYVTFNIDEDPDLNDIEPVFIRGNGQRVSGTIEESEGKFSNDAFEFWLNDQGVQDKLYVNVTDEDLLEEGGTVEVTFTVHLPDNVTVEQLLEAGCVLRDGSYLFINGAEVDLGGCTLETNTTKTHVLTDDGLTITKNVIGDEVGNEEFRFTIEFSDLTEGEVYTYVKPSPVVITAEKTGNQVTFTAEDPDGNELEDIKFSIYNDDDELLATLTTASDGTASMNLTNGGYWILCGGKDQYFEIAGGDLSFETMYAQSENDVTEFTANGSGNKTLSFTLSDGQSITFKGLPTGAKYKITEAANSCVASFVVIKGMAYVETDSLANDDPGEAISTDTEFVFGDKSVTYMFNNEVEPVDVTVEKRDLLTDELIDGARLIVVDEEENVVADWNTADDNPFTFNVYKGKTYTLSEVYPPDNYQDTNDIVFRVLNDANGTIQVYDDENEEFVTVPSRTVTMYDEPVAPPKVEIKKVDQDGNMIAGAVLEILDSEGDPVTGGRFTTSATDTFEIELPIGEYTLTEVSPPSAAYRIAEDIPFTVEGGKITSVVAGAVGGGVLTMTDEFVQSDINVTKTVTGSGADPNEWFTFTMQLTGLTPGTAYSVTGTRQNVSASVGTWNGTNNTITPNNSGNATFTFKLKDGQNLKVNDVPVGTTYNVTEAASSYYARYAQTASEPSPTFAHATATNQTPGQLSTGVETVNMNDGNITVAFTNSMDIPVPTGTRMIWRLIVLALLLAGAALAYIRRRSKLTEKA